MYLLLIKLPFLWAVFSGIFYISGNVWKAPTVYISIVHYLLGGIVIVLFIYKLYVKDIVFAKIEERRYLVFLILSLTLSLIFNYSNPISTIKFSITLISPVIVYLVLVYDKAISQKQINKLLNFYLAIAIFQLSIAVIKNYDVLSYRNLVIDDNFRGTTGAYHFVFLLNLYTINLIKKFIFLKKINIMYLIIIALFPMTFIISGAGGYFFLFIASQLINIIIFHRHFSNIMNITLGKIP